MQPSKLAWRGKIPSPSVGCVPARDNPGSSNPVPTAGDPRGDKSHCSGGAGCESGIPTLSRSALNVHIKPVLRLSIGPLRIISLRIKKFRIEAGTKALCIKLGYNFDAVEAGLSLPDFLHLEHSQTSYSLKSVRYGKLPRPDAFTQASTCCLHLCNPLADSALLDTHLFLYQIKNRVFQTGVHLTCNPRSPGLSGLPSKIQVPW